MKKPHHPAIRDLLRQNPDGLTVPEILQKLPQVSKDSVLRKCLEAMPDAYIDRWTKMRNSRGQYLAIWCVVVPPENCPYPTDRFEKPATQWVDLANMQPAAA